MEKNKIHLIMPMGGAGSRFFKNGFVMPKPLIEINGYPFLYWATLSISKFVDVVQIVGIGLFVVFVGVSVFLIMNTIKLTVYSRRREVGIMKFVGATDWFIRWPFVIEGIVIGAIGSLLSSILLYFAYNGIFRWIVSSMFIVNLVQPQFVLTTLLACFVGGGVVVGAIGSIFALRKFLIV